MYLGILKIIRLHVEQLTHFDVRFCTILNKLLHTEYISEIKKCENVTRSLSDEMLYEIDRFATLNQQFCFMCVDRIFLETFQDFLS